MYPKNPSLWMHPQTTDCLLLPSSRAKRSGAFSVSVSWKKFLCVEELAAMLEEHWQKECLAPNSLLESVLLSILERNFESPLTVFYKVLPMGLFPGSTVWLWFTLCAFIPGILGAKCRLILLGRVNCLQNLPCGFREAK